VAQSHELPSPAMHRAWRLIDSSVATCCSCTCAFKFVQNDPRCLIHDRWCFEAAQQLRRR
jgi:hypothetical protein